MMAPPKLPRRTCEVGGCVRLVHRHDGDYCNAHLLRLERHGDLMADVPIQPRTKRQPGQRTAEDPALAGWLTTGDVAALFGYEKTWIKRAADQGRIPHTRTANGHRRFDPKVVYPMVGKGIPPLPVDDDDTGGFVARCRRCGCTDAQPCFGGCTWVATLTTREGEMCSRCAPAVTRKRVPAGVK